MKARCMLCFSRYRHIVQGRKTEVAVSGPVQLAMGPIPSAALFTYFIYLQSCLVWFRKALGLQVLIGRELSTLNHLKL